jgi:hypothetical protein
MFIRKFYDTATAEPATQVEEPIVEELGGAAALAKFGQKSDENRVFTPPVKIEKEVEKPVEEVTPTAKVEEPQTTENPTSETQVQEEEPKKVETQPIVAEPIKVPTLDEVLKNNQPDTILKALGFDDEKAQFVSELKDADPKLVAIMQAYKNGNLGDYVRELATDYQKMSAEDLMRHQLRLEYPKASAAAFEALYEAEVTDRYKLDPDTYTEAEVERGKLLLEAKADKYRDDFTAKQEKYLLPAKPEPKATVDAVVDNTAETQRQQIEAYRKDLSETPYAKDIFANKKITLGEGDEKFSYPVEPNALIDILTDGKKWAETMWNTDGTPKTEHQLAVAAFAQDSKKFLNEYAKHLKAIGAKEVIDPIDNASVPDKSTASKSETQPITAAANLAKKGMRSNGGMGE